MKDRSRSWNRHGLDLFDVAILVTLAVLSVWLLAFLLARVGPNHVWTGTDGPYIGDQLQYLGWIHDASRHLLIANPFDSVPGAADYLNPALVISGLFVRSGMTASLSYLLWTPVAVIVLFGAARGYCWRVLEATAQRRSALVLALFYISPVAVLTSHPSWLPALDRYFLPVISREMWAVLYLWGYPLTAIAVASLALCLLAYERDRVHGRVRPWAPLLGLLCAWMQPWQGATLLGVLVISEAALWFQGDRGRVPLFAASAGGTAAPLAYYAALSRFDSTWALGGRANFLVVPGLAIVVALLPLGLPAVLAYRLRAVTFQAVALRAWPIVAVGIYWTIAWSHFGTYPLHAFQGLSIPLACLAVTGACSIRIDVAAPVKVALGSLLVLLLLLPAGVQNLNAARSVGFSEAYGQDPYFVTDGEHQALDFLQHSALPGAVLAPIYLGQAVPAETGRQTWVGIFSWTPDYTQRVALADDLFSGRLSPARARALIKSSGARFLLSDCQENFDLERLVPSTLTGTRHFGCATVYRVARGS